MHKGLSILLLRDQLTPQFKTLGKDEQLDIENHSKSLKHQRESFTQELLANLKKVDSNTEELKKAISLDIQNIGLHYFKDVIKEINTCLDRNDNILNLKQKEINEEEKILSNELKQVEQRIFDLSIGKTNLTKKTALHYKPLETYHVNLPESICAFDDFLLKSGGHSGGWKAEDHQMFLHLKNKYKTEQVAEMLHSKLPDISVDQILEHDKWYEKYTKLLQDKKHTVEKWKSSRKSGRSQSVGNIEEIMRTETPDSSLSSTRRRNEWKKPDAEVKKQIADWKLTKALKLKEEQAQKRQEEEKNRAMEKEKKEMKVISF
ncbi:hypothetical protein M8J76_005749 [Diaphorina citri]|nr:hypothetical protein M8J76_005749 [Diaphorina citri]